MSFGLSVPALRGKQGDRIYYQANIPNSVLNNFFPINMEPEADRSQRTVDPKHAQEIADYVVDNADNYVLGAITYSMDTEGEFASSSLHPDIGVLTIPVNASMRSLDGQHRRLGLKKAIDEDPDVAHDTLSVLLYVEPDLLARRQMFSDMNATPKVVAKALNVSFDTRDPFALAAVRLAEEHPMLKGHVEMQAARVKPASANYTSLAGVYDALKRIKHGSVLPRGRAQKQDANDLFDLGSKFFDVLDKARPEFAAAAQIAEDYTGDDLVAEMKTLRESSILFSTTTLRAIAGAVHDVIELVGFDEGFLIKGLASIDFKPSSPAFIKVGFVTPPKSTPNARNQEVLAASKVVFDAIVGSASKP